MRKILEQCPSCGSAMEVTRMHCTSCETIVQGRYQPCPFCSLDPDKTAFLMAFVRNRGNVKEMERELGISYWTVRRRLDELIEELGFEPEESATANQTAHQLSVLERVNRGEISAAEAFDLLSEQ